MTGNGLIFVYKKIAAGLQRKGQAMTEAIVVAVLSLIGTLAGSYFSSRKSAVLVAYRLEQLEKKVQAHNNLVERTYKLEERVELHEEKLKVANHRIEDMEKEHV